MSRTGMPFLSSPAKKFPSVQIKVGPEFQSLISYKILVEADGSDPCELDAQNRLELRHVSLKDIEPIDLKLTIQKFNPESKKFEIFAMKQVEMPFGKEWLPQKLFCGTKLGSSLTLDLRVYC